MHSSTVENYLKAIWHLQQDLADGELVTVGRIAEALAVTPGTATTMMNHLKKNDLVDYTPRRGVRLNPHGEATAVQVLRRHRLIELFLVEVMQIDWEHVHEEAEVLEHVISDRLLERMDEMLGNPSHDPHGDPIPSSSGVIPRQTTINLADCAPGHYTLKRVSEDDPSFLTWLSSQQLTPGVSFHLSSRDPHASTLTLSRSGQPDLLLAHSAAQSLLVTPVD